MSATICTKLTLGKDGRVPNISPQFVANIEKGLELTFITDGPGDLLETFGPEDIFHYAYATFHSPTYRGRYAEFLKVDFPRLSITSDRELFSALVQLGADLVALHLLEDDYPSASWIQRGEGSPLQYPITTFVEQATATTMGALSKRTCYQDGRIYLDTSEGKRSSYFEGVPEEVWNFQVGGFQVCYKWLYDRRGTKGEPGQTLTPEDIEHYQRIVVALKETMRLMGEIDEVIEEHGGWPIE
jgi:predicted helicase